MRRLGLLGGMSWESSSLYYTLLNQEVRDRLGGMHSARCVMSSVDFAEVEELQRAGDWERAGELLAAEARALEVAGAELLVLCTNTMHKVAPAIERACGVPLLHLGDVTAEAVLAAGLDTVTLLGTAFTMEQAFYRDRVAAHGLSVRVPGAEDRATVHRVIYDELVRGLVRDESRRAVCDVMERELAAGSQGVVLGCTELELLVGPDDVAAPVFPTTRLHVMAAVEASLAGP